MRGFVGVHRLELAVRNEARLASGLEVELINRLLELLLESEVFPPDPREPVRPNEKFDVTERMGEDAVRRPRLVEACAKLKNEHLNVFRSVLNPKNDNTCRRTIDNDDL